VNDTSTPVTRVLIVDDHRMFADSLVRLLDDEPDLEVVGLAGNMADAIRAASSTRPDVALIDFRLPDGDAPECFVRLSKISPDTRALIVTGLNDDGTMRAARNAGCLVVTKDRAAAELVGALRAVAAGASADLEDASLLPFRPGPAPMALVSDREHDVLERLAQGLSTAQMADALGISQTTVRNHVQRVLAKLGAHSRLEAVAIAIHKGIIAR